MAMPAPDAVKCLVDRFDQDRKVFLSGDYKEEQLRLEFLNPLFTALGWDMDNRQGLSGFSVLANLVHSSRSIVPGAEDRKPGTKNREPGTDDVIRLTAGHRSKVEEKPEGLASTRALDGPSVLRKLSALRSEPRPVLTDTAKMGSVPHNPRST
jgi:hypothetical protein